MAEAVVRRDGADLLLVIHAQPGASRSEFAGMHGEALKVRVRAPAVDGKANDALRRFLADAFSVSPTRVELVSGPASRHKRWRIRDPQRMPPEIVALLAP